MIRVFTPSLRWSVTTGLTLCRTRLVHAKVGEKKYKSIPHFRLFFDVMFFSLPLCLSGLFKFRILFSLNQIFNIVSES